MILATFGLALGFPLGILVALGRRSELPAIKALCVRYVELIRGVPLVSLLFMASVMFSLFMPDGFNIDKLLRAQIAIILFAGAYLAEVVRAGLQAVPKGQSESAEALGLSYWKRTGLIILPQALRQFIPPLVNTFIAFFKDTSLVLIIGIFDLLTAAKATETRSAWSAICGAWPTDDAICHRSSVEETRELWPQQTLRILPLLRACQIPVEGKCVAIQIIESELARPPRSVVDAVGSALDATLPVFAEECVWVLNQKPQADGAHFVLELKLHVELHRVTAKSDVVR